MLEVGAVEPEADLVGDLYRGLETTLVKTDPTSADARLLMPFAAYAPSADVTAAVVYVNYGRIEDYDYLAQANQKGGGNVKEKMRPSSPTFAPLSTSKEGDAEQNRPMSAPLPRPVVEQQQVMTTHLDSRSRVEELERRVEELERERENERS